MTVSNAGTLLRRELVRDVLHDEPELLVVAGLGSACWDVTAAGDRDLNFYLWGAMGGAVMIGLGLALAQPERRVLVITGDGEMLMGLGSLAVVAASNPPNLAILVLDNERYGETGHQPTHTAFGVDLEGIAAAAGFSTTLTVRTQEECTSLRRELAAAPGPVFAVAKVAETDDPLVLPSNDGSLIARRFRQAVHDLARERG